MFPQCFSHLPILFHQLFVSMGTMFFYRWFVYHSFSKLLTGLLKGILVSVVQPVVFPVFTPISWKRGPGPEQHTTFNCTSHFQRTSSRRSQLLGSWNGERAWLMLASDAQLVVCITGYKPLVDGCLQ